MEGRREQELAAVLGIGRVGGSKQVDPSLKQVAEAIDKIKHLEVKQKQRQHIKRELKSTIKTDELIKEENNKMHIITTLEESINNDFIDDYKVEVVGEYECTICEKMFDTKKRLKSHKDSKHRKSLNINPERALCNVCSKTFSSKYYLDSHIKTIHELRTESDAINCEVCKKTFSNKYLAKYHMRTHDTGAEVNLDIVTCNLCSKIYSNKHTLKAHKLTHDPDHKTDRALCSECSRSFSGKTILKKHIMSEHGDQKYTPCPVCGLAFTVFSISKHTKLCKLPENEKEEIREKKKVECNDCGKILADKVKLKRHIRFIHNQEKQFECNFCDHKDFRKDNIKVHIENNHLGQNPHESFSRITPTVDF